MMRFSFFCLILIGFLACSSPAVENMKLKHESNLDWKPFTKSLFDEAKSTEKLVLLNIGANWCHWCHVMDDSTYSNPEVQKLLSENFIISHEDQDSRSDLFSKYRDYGWPATIVFNADGEELLKLKGYQHRTKFISTLQEVIKNPIVIFNDNHLNQEVNEIENLNLDSISRNNNSQLISTFNQLVDHNVGSLKTYKKSLNKSAIDLAFETKNDSLKNWLRLSIKKSYNLLDPIWGGVYQYSTHNDWHNQHFEKILRVQAEYISMYTQFGFEFSDTVAISNAEKIYDYCNRFLSDNAPLFDNSQDADYIKGIESSHYYSLSEIERLKLGTPAVNHQQFLKENAMMAVSLAKLWAVTNNKKYLVRSEKIVNLLMNDFLQSNGLFSRSKDDNLIYSLEDNVALLEALTMAYQISGDVIYLDQANELSSNIIAHFLNDDGLLFSSCGDIVVTPTILPNSNYSAAFSIFQVGSILANNVLMNSAKSIVYNIYQPDFDSSEYMIPCIIKARNYFETEPFHAVWISNKFGTELELSFIQKIILNFGTHVVIDRVDLNNLTDTQDALYGTTKPNTLFLCTSNFCSSPITKIEQLEDFFEQQ